jgi:hypothetical protein
MDNNLAQMCVTNHRVARVELLHLILMTCHVGTLLDLDLWVKIQKCHHMAGNTFQTTIGRQETFFLKDHENN